MCDFKPGDEVVCVYAGPISGSGCWIGDPPVEGKTYTVTGITVALDGTPAVLLAEIDSGMGDGEYRASRFRKVQRKKTDLAAWLAQTTDFEEPKRRRSKKREKA